MKLSSRTVGVHGLLAFASLTIVVPLAFVVNVAFKTPQEFVLDPVGLASAFTLQNFVGAWERARLPRYLANSILYAASVAVVTVIVGIMASYPISREHIRRFKLAYAVFTAGIFLPLSLVPTVHLMDGLGLMNQRIGYVLLTTALRLPLTIVIFVGFIKSVPRELDEAAAVDGCGYYRFMSTILTPMMKPSIATVLTLTAIHTWNDFVNPFLFLSDPTKRPVTSGLYVFFGQYGNQWTLLSAAIIIISIPMVVVFLAMQRHIISGIAGGALKG